jgi:hypothetical protein
MGRVSISPRQRVRRGVFELITSIMERDANGEVEEAQALLG